MTPQELAELDLQVAKAEDKPDAAIKDGRCEFRNNGWTWVYEPTRDPAEAMRLLEKYRLSLLVCGDGHPDMGWTCYPAQLPWKLPHPIGETPCIAICRAVIALTGAA